MASHLSSIGFRAGTEEEFRTLAVRAAQAGRTIEVRGGSYVFCRDKSGAELWAQTNEKRELIGLNPHFAGTALMRVKLVGRVSRPNDSALDGAFHGWADPSGESEGDGVYPFVFDVPDYVTHDSVRVPSVVKLQIAAFAHELSAFGSEADFDASQTTQAKFAAESFIPSGLFSPDGKTTAPPRAEAIITGHVVACSTLTNSMTSIAFQWARVRTLGGEVDVVADPDVVGTITQGGIASGSFWLSGRIVDDERRQRTGLLKKLFGR